MGIFSRPVDRDEENQVVAAPYSAPRTITAAATKISLKDDAEIESLRKRRSAKGWQQQAWEYYDLIGEIKYSANLISSVMSRVLIYGAYITDEDMTPAPLKLVESGDVSPELRTNVGRAISLLSTGPGGIPGMLQKAAQNLFVTGECYLIQQPARPGKLEKESWQIRSIDELEIVSTRSTAGGRKGQTLAVKPRAEAKGDELIELPTHNFVGRIWRMHPRFSDDADSSMRGNLELMDELLLLNKDARATIKSRLNAGILLLPDDLSNISQMDGVTIEEGQLGAGEEDTDDMDSFEEELQAAMLTPISDEGSASAVVPLIIRGPAAALKEIRHITTSRAFDQQHAIRADKVLDRILAALDIPKETVAGIADSKYANATVVEESLLTHHIEPMILQIVDALTTVFLHPVLRSFGHTDEEISRIVIWYDPSAITTKPSKAEAADSGFQHHAISAKAWRRAHGFHESDAPSELEVAQRLAIDRGMLSEPITEAILKTIIPDLLAQVQAQQLAQSGDTGEVLSQVDGQVEPEGTEAGTATGSGLIEPGEEVPSTPAPTPSAAGTPSSGLLEP
jgi:hypothetical protein